MESVGDYEYNPSDILGQGAFAVVYKGRSKKDPSFIVAIKSILKKKLKKSPDLLSKEIKILKELTELHHEHVVALLDCKESKNNVFLVMEYCNGGDLADYLSENGTLSEDTIRLFVKQLAGAMRALFAKGIVHRDLKPQNILLSYKSTTNNKKRPNPSDIKLKIADFGFARFLQDGVMAATLCGSPMYMAPEVIMSFQYGAKADLWSLGTIVYQCLTGRSPFLAGNPHELKALYEKTANLAPKIPLGTSPELSDLLMGLLKRNYRERMDFEVFFNHKFLQREVPAPAPLPGDLPVPIFSTSPLTRVNCKPSTPLRTNTPPRSQPESPRSARTALSSSPEDDYVIVSKDAHFISSNQSIEMSLEKETEEEKERDEKSNNNLKLSIRSNNAAVTLETTNVPERAQEQNLNSPSRPNILPFSEPIPVPTQREAYQQMRRKRRESAQLSSAIAGSSEVIASAGVPRSLPITVKRPPDRQISNDIDIASLSPPSVQFIIGTPPGGRRRTSSSSLCETPPPPPNLWTVSPTGAIATSAKNLSSNSPLKRSGTSSPIMTRVPILSSPNLSDNNNLGRGPVLPFSTRAMTLPEISEMDQFYDVFQNIKLQTSDYDPPIIPDFVPELPEETLLGKEHNEALARLNFVLAVSTCIIEMAVQYTVPIKVWIHRSMATDTIASIPPALNVEHRTKQVVLLFQAVKILTKALSLASEQVDKGELICSTTVKNVISKMLANCKTAHLECKKILNSGCISNTRMKADEIIYEHTMLICQSGSVDELFNFHLQACFERYRTAQILLHYLAQVAFTNKDRKIFEEYKSIVESRLYQLQEKGIGSTTDAL